MDLSLAMQLSSQAVSVFAPINYISVVKLSYDTI